MKVRKTISNGQTGFFLRGDHELKVRVVNGVMFKLLNANQGDTLTAIYSLRLIRKTYISVMCSKRERLIYIHLNRREKLLCAPIGCKVRLSKLASALSTTYPLHRRRKEQVAMWRSTYLNRRSLRVIGPRVGSG